MRFSVLYNLPNLLTYARILAVAGVVICFYFDGDRSRWIAFGIFVAAAITDFLDGYFARLWQQQTSLGRMLDPIADKLLVAACLLMLASEGTIGDWSLLAAIVILCREILVSGLREYLAEVKVSVPVSWLAKWKTTLQLVAIGFLLIGPAGDKILPGTTMAGMIFLWISAILTLYTGWDYFRASVSHIIEADE